MLHTLNLYAAIDDEPDEGGTLASGHRLASQGEYQIMVRMQTSWFLPACMSAGTGPAYPVNELLSCANSTAAPCF
jgi:hypothetical protein